MSRDYADLYARSIEDPESFWGEQAGLVDWITKPHQGARRRTAAVLPLVPRRRR